MAVKASKTKTWGRSGGISGRGVGIGVIRGKANTTAHPEFPDKAV